MVQSNKYPETLIRYEPPIGGADKLLKHLENKVEPYIKKKLKTQNYRIGMGYSLGATFTMYASMKSKILFDYSILMSPNFTYDSSQYIKRIQDFTEINNQKRSYYICNGYGDEYEKQKDC